MATGQQEEIINTASFMVLNKFWKWNYYSTSVYTVVAGIVQFTGVCSIQVQGDSKGIGIASILFSNGNCWYWCESPNPQR